MRDSFHVLVKFEQTGVVIMLRFNPARRTKMYSDSRDHISLICSILYNLISRFWNLLCFSTCDIKIKAIVFKNFTFLLSF